MTAYWANTSSNGLAGELIRESARDVKESFERLMKGEHFWISIDEQIIYDQLDNNEYAIWSLIVAGGYLKILDYEKYEEDDLVEEPKYELTLTNHEVEIMFKNMNRVALATFSYFDTGKQGSGKEEQDAIVIEFKVYNPRRDASLEDTVSAALAQIEEKQYTQTLIAKGIPEERIRKL